MNFCCDNCECSRCKLWKECNDYVYNLDYWCYCCSEISIDSCFEQDGSCEKFSFDKDLTHPIYSEQTLKEAGQYYERLNSKLVC
jgi:hypothetical protein